MAEFRDQYPACEEFFAENEDALLARMGNVRTEKELEYPHQSILTSSLRSDLSYEYPSTSVFAVEDLLIDLLDFKRELFRQVGEFDRIDITH